MAKKKNRIDFRTLYLMNLSDYAERHDVTFEIVLRMQKQHMRIQCQSCTNATHESVLSSQHRIAMMTLFPSFVNRV